MRDYAAALLEEYVNFRPDPIFSFSNIHKFISATVDGPMDLPRKTDTDVHDFVRLTVLLL